LRAHLWLRWLHRTFGPRQYGNSRRPTPPPSFLPSLESLELRLAPAAVTFIVNTLLDTHLANPASTNGIDTNGKVSLRSALEAAENLTTPTTVTIQLAKQPGVINLSLGELAFGSTNDDNIIITGATSGGAPATTINQTDGMNRIFDIDPGAAGNVTATINNVTLKGGFASNSTAPFASFGGGAILGGSPGDVLNLTNDVLTDNASDSGDNGGAIAWVSGGDLNISNSTFSNNTSNIGAAGALFFNDNANPGNLSITNSSFTGNTATAGTTSSGSIAGQGGALALFIAAGSTATIGSTTFTGNVAVSFSSSAAAPQGQGGAVYFLGDPATGNPAGTATITDCTFLNNMAQQVGGGGPGQGGAIFVEGGDLSLSFSRLEGNVAATGSGVDNSGDNPAVVSATNDWWATNVGPSAFTAGTVSDATWLVLTDAASPTTIGVGQNSTLTADFTHDNTGTNVAGFDPMAGQTFPAFIGLSVTYGAFVDGTPSNQEVSIQSGGTATATYTATTAGNGSSTVAVDGATATATITVQPSVDLQVTTADNTGTGSAIPGTAITYTVTVHNAGPSAVSGATVTDLFPAALSGVTFTASATGGATGFTANGSGNISDTVVLPVGSTVTYIATATISPSATGTLSNTATAATPTGITDTDANGSTATDTVTLTPQANLQVTQSAASSVAAGTDLTYTVTVINAGPSNAQNVLLSDLLPGGGTFVSQAQTSGSATFTLANNANQVIDAIASLPSGASVTFTVKAHVQLGAINTVLVNTATVTAADLAPNDNTTVFTVSTSVQGPKIVVTPAILSSARVGVGYSQTFTASGGTSAYTFHVTSGSLPVGMSLNATTGILAGTPQRAGTFTFTVAATDANSFSGNASYTLTVQQGALARLVFLTQPAAGQPNTFLAPIQVKALDRFGNLLNGVVVSLALVPITSVGSTGFLAGSVLQATTVNGVATFSRVAISTTRGLFQLRASAPLISGVLAYSNSFEVGILGRHASGPHS
jgi:uncharacterized repeat protein (TIGR01451 family)